MSSFLVACDDDRRQQGHLPLGLGQLLQRVGENHYQQNQSIYVKLKSTASNYQRVY